MTDSKKREKVLQDIAKFRLFDDTFMSAVFDGQISETKLLLEIVLQRNDIDVISSKSQYYLSNLQYREVRLDIYAKDSQNNAYHVEVQRDLRGASVRRARFTAALVDSKLLIKGQKFDELPERYTILIRGISCCEWETW
jgi:predicted transposase/invertase (TIGR01784 family)